MSANRIEPSPRLDVYHRAMPGEPTFTLLGRDPEAPMLLRQWADRRRLAILRHERDEMELRACQAADEIADEMEEWRRVHDGEWRLVPPEEAVPARYNDAGPPQ